MKASLRSARIAPKKANLIARMVRGMPVMDAIDLMERTHKKGARMIEDLLKSAVANASHNDKQDPGSLEVRTIIVNQGAGYRRGVPMARGRIRPMIKFLSHIDVVLGVRVRDSGDSRESGESGEKKKKAASKASQASKKTVQRTKTKDVRSSDPSTSSPARPRSDGESSVSSS